MTYCFYITACLGLVIFQTALMPYWPLMNSFYDLLIPFVIYLGIARPARESLPFIIFLGFIMDNISGSPFGLYLTVYLWLFIGIRLTATMLRVSNSILMALLVVAGVLIENLVFIATYALGGPDLQLPAHVIRVIVIQAIWAIFTGPLLILFFRSSHHFVETGLVHWLARLKASED